MSIRIINQLQKTKTDIYNTSITYEQSTEAGKGNTKRDCCKVLYTIHGLELKADDKVERHTNAPTKTGRYNEQANKGVSAVLKGRKEKEGTRN